MDKEHKSKMQEMMSLMDRMQSMMKEMMGGMADGEKSPKMKNGKEMDKGMAKVMGKKKMVMDERKEAIKSVMM